MMISNQFQFHSFHLNFASCLQEKVEEDRFIEDQEAIIAEKYHQLKAAEMTENMVKNASVQDEHLKMQRAALCPSYFKGKRKAPSSLWKSTNAGKDESGDADPLFSKELIQELTSLRERNKGQVVAASTEREVVGRRPLAPQQMGKQEFGKLSSSSSMRTLTLANVSKAPTVIEDMPIAKGLLPSIGNTNLIGLPKHIRDFVGAEEERDIFLDEMTREFTEVEEPFEIIIKLDPLVNASEKPKGLPFSFMPEATNKSTNDKRKLSPVKNRKAPSREKVEKKISSAMPPPPVPTSGQGWGNIFANVNKGKWKCNVSFLYVRRNFYPLLNLSLL